MTDKPEPLTAQELVTIRKNHADHTRADDCWICQFLATIDALREENKRLRQDMDLLTMENDKRLKDKDGLTGAAVAVIRDILKRNDVPLAAFIDDHVTNAIVQRDQVTAERDALRAEVEKLREALTNVMLWIDNWAPDFIQDDEWPATDALARAALKEKPHGE